MIKYGICIIFTQLKLLFITSISVQNQLNLQTLKGLIAPPFGLIFFCLTLDKFPIVLVPDCDALCVCVSVCVCVSYVRSVYDGIAETKKGLASCATCCNRCTSISQICTTGLHCTRNTHACTSQKATHMSVAYIVVYAIIAESVWFGGSSAALNAMTVKLVYAFAYYRDV